ncbi:hypothetical protein ADUPG1_009846 [Aduncisulcus paluster]|uniref:Uncharacterized protein n=1 Tax=Aduncisulcus paluster TaxID=2918883 RepID=A0ABQ5KY62_9EUKA|nr:hypothetical protein ADUPG1_009846 [Aduncisulcus paluster]
MLNRRLSLSSRLLSELKEDNENFRSSGKVSSCFGHDFFPTLEKRIQSEQTNEKVIFARIKKKQEEERMKREEEDRKKREAEEKKKREAEEKRRRFDNSLVLKHVHSEYLSIDYDKLKTEVQNEKLKIINAIGISARKEQAYRICLVRKLVLKCAKAVPKESIDWIEMVMRETIAKISFGELESNSVLSLFLKVVMSILLKKYGDADPDLATELASDAPEHRKQLVTLKRKGVNSLHQFLEQPREHKHESTICVLCVIIAKVVQLLCERVFVDVRVGDPASVRPFCHFAVCIYHELANKKVLDAFQVPSDSFLEILSSPGLAFALCLRGYIVEKIPSILCLKWKAEYFKAHMAENLDKNRSERLFLFHCGLLAHGYSFVDPNEIFAWYADIFNKKKNMMSYCNNILTMYSVTSVRAFRMLGNKVFNIIHTLTVQYLYVMGKEHSDDLQIIALQNLCSNYQKGHKLSDFGIEKSIEDLK